jgi:hypothetical protein
MGHDVATFLDHVGPSHLEESQPVSQRDVIFEFGPGDARCRPLEGQDGAGVVVDANADCRLGASGQIALPECGAARRGGSPAFTLNEKFPLDLGSHDLIQ